MDINNDRGAWSMVVQEFTDYNLRNSAFDLYPRDSQREGTSIIGEGLKILNPLSSLQLMFVCYEDTFSLTWKTSATDRDHGQVSSKQCHGRHPTNSE